MGNELEHQQRRESGSGDAGADHNTPGKTTLANSGQTQPTGLARLYAAAMANDLQLLAAIQREFRAQMIANDPVNPPQEAREVLATLRHWGMDRVASLRDSYAARLTAASATATATAPATGTEALEEQMDRDCTPYLDLLGQGDPQYRYEHFNQTVAEKVFAAVRLHAARRSVSQVGSLTAENESKQRGGLGATDDWCGAFAFTQAEQAGGFDAQWRGSMQGELGIRSALAYGDTAQIWIWAFDHWENLRTYHQSRGSERWYEEIQRAAPSHGIQPGDLVLIDNSFGTNPDHITTAASFDGRWLTTVGGNQGSGAAGVARNRPIDITANPDPNDVRAIENGQRVRRVDPNAGPKHVRVHGIGRWSIVDYERHIYRTSPQRPSTPPAAAQLRQIG